MSRQFSIQTVLRMVPKDLLGEFFESLGHTDHGINWSELHSREIGPIAEYMDGLTRQQLNTIESALRCVFDLACPGGLDALVEAGPHVGDLDFASNVPAELCVYGSAMWAWLHHRELFEKAQAIHQVESIAWWRKRNDLPRKEPRMSQEALTKLAQDISMLVRSQGRGMVKDCTVETMLRNGIDYFFGYPDDLVQNFVTHDKDGRLTPLPFRITLLVVFAYNRQEGSLELFTKLPKRIKERLEPIFADAILDCKLGPLEPPAAYELNQLKSPSFDLRTDPADGLRVQIRKMRLSAREGGRRVLIEVDRDDDIHCAIADCIRFDEVPISEWNMTLVTFYFEFLEMPGRTPGHVTFDVGFPRTCSLRNARPERAELIHKYLKRWNIDRVEPAGDDPVSLGDDYTVDRRSGSARPASASL